MMKTVAPKEQQLLKKMLKRYYEYITSNPGTLLVRFLGLHCLRVKKTTRGRGSGKDRKLYFVVMGNMFNTPFEIHRRYDLKGSWVGRFTKAEHFDPTVALKDVDFQQANEKVRIGTERKEALSRIMTNDAQFLSENNIIDYSVLLGIHDISASSHNLGSEEDQEIVPTFSGDDAQGRVVPIHQRDMGGMLSSDKKSLYFLGIIDILTPYDKAKVLEHHFKALRHERQGVSCCPPPMYADRFSKFMTEALL